MPGKTWWLGSGEEKPPYDSPQTKHLRAEVEGIIEDAKRGVRRKHIFNDFPKDERRSLDKIAARKTRSISGCPLDFAIAMKMYFGAFAVFFMKNRIKNHSAVGINARSQEWTHLVEEIRRFAHQFDGDYGGFDTNMSAEPLWVVVDIVNEWFHDSPENQLIRKVLWSSIVNSLHIYEGTVYLWSMSNPSGNIFTVILNCIVNMIYMQCCYAKLNPLKIVGLPYFYDDVVHMTYGDDAVTSVSDRASGFFNQITVAQAMSDLGQTYTDSDKKTPRTAFRKFEDLSFLKRGFRYDRGVGEWVAPLSLKTITEMPYWTKSGPGSDAITRSNANEALIELSLHGEKLFDEWSQKIVEACKQRLNWMPERSTYKACIDFAMTHEVIY
jgi:hypothetical protein